MVWLKGFRLAKPEIGNLSQYLAFARDAIGHNTIKSGDAVSGDEQQPITEVEAFSYFAALNFANARKVELEDGLVFGQHGRKYGRDEIKFNRKPPSEIPKSKLKRQ